MICIISVCSLIAIYCIIESNILNNKPAVYNVLVNNGVASSENGISVVIGDNSEDLSKIMTINGLSNRTPNTYIYSSQLSSASGKTINNILFGGKSAHTIDNDLPKPINLSKVTINVSDEGIYHGFLYLYGDTLTSIPISVSTEPKILQAILIIVIGILTSIIAWEIFFVFDRKNNEKGSQYLSEMAYELDRALAANGLTDNLSYFQIQNNVDLMYKNALLKKNRAINLRLRYSTNSAKIISIEAATILSGIFVGLTGYFNNDYINNLVVIRWTDAAYLFLTGMGIGSLKGLVER